MKFHAPTKQIVIPVKALEEAAITMLYTIASIRKLAKKPLRPYKRKEGMLREEDHELDVSDYAN